VKSSRTQRSEKKKMKMFSKNLVKSSRIQKEHEEEDRTSCQRNLLGGRLKNPKEQEEYEHLVKGTDLVQSSRTQRCSKKKKMNILSKELTW
jgi:hypothetical protein